MTDPIEPNSSKLMIPPDLQKQVEEIQKNFPGTTGPPGDLDEEKKRWLIVGICLHSIISPILRKYVDPIIINLYNSLVSSQSINTQGYPMYLDKYPPTNNYYLNYESVNNNRNVPKKKIYNKWINDYQKYDYKITSHVDLSKLFLQPNMTHYSAITDDSCDSSALLGMVINISSFPPSVQTNVEKMRLDIRNPWAHCDFREWTATKYTDSFQLMGQLVQNLGLSNKEENIVLGELNTWATNGQLFLSGTRLGLEIVEEMSKQTYILSKYVHALCSETDGQFFKVQNELKKLENGLQERNSNFESKTKKIEAELDDMKEEIKEQVDHIPKHIRALHGLEISEWENDDCLFVETRATKHILGSLISNNSIVVTGSSGCGKSSNIHHTALYLRDSFGYEIIPVFTGPTGIMHYYNVNQKQVFVVDDICGKETINMQILQMWRDYSVHLEKLFKTVNVKGKNKNDTTLSDVSHSKLLISCRLHIYKESKFQLIPLLTRKECNLLSPEFCLLQNEKLILMQKYLRSDIIEHVTKILDNFDFFPLLCKLSKSKTLDEAIKLFTAPEDSIAKNIIHIIVENKIQFCALVLCILFDDGFNTQWLNIKHAPEKKISKLKAVVQEFEIDLNKEMSRITLIACFLTLDGTYLRHRGTEYRLIHDKIYKIASIICGQYLPEFFIKHASYLFIRDSFIFESIIEAQTNDNTIILSNDKEVDYFERLLTDLRHFVITSTFQNKQLIYPQFIDKLISFFEKSDEGKTLLKRLDTEGCKVEGWDPYCYTTPLIEAASSGYVDVVSFLIETVKCDVNKKCSSGNTSLHTATKRGRAKVVELLLQKNANVSQCDFHGDSPLIIACTCGYTDIVELLIHKNADVDKCNKFGDSPLIIACKNGYTDIVELLIQNMAADFESKLISRPLLLEACRGRYTDTVKLLLKYKADVSKCDSKGHSPLYIACEQGCIDIASLLLENNADVDQNKGELSPIYSACKSGIIDIVKLLLKYNTDVSECDKKGQSPLYMACERGFLDIVELLLLANAVVSPHNKYSRPPLHVACRGGHTDIVKILLLNNASVHQYNEDCESPLYVACKGGFIDIAQVLLNNDADVSQCTHNEDSPLFVACERGHTEIVKLLVQNNAEISPCNFDGKSSLYIACERGHTDIVKLLLQTKSDVTHFDYNNDPALDVACSRGHTDIVKMLLQNNKDIYQCNGYWEYLLKWVCWDGHADIATFLLQERYNVLKCTNTERSSMSLVNGKSQNETEKMLPQNIAETLLCNINETSLLHVACARGHTAIVKVLLQNKVDQSQFDLDGNSLLCVSCEGGHTSTVKLLLQGNANISQCNKLGNSPLYVACERGHTETVKLLIINNADISQCNNRKESPLYIASKSGCTIIVELLLQNNADISQYDEYGQSPLHIACKVGHVRIVKLLLKNKANVFHCETKNGQSPLHFSVDIASQLAGCRCGCQIPQVYETHVKIAQLLIAMNADIRMTDKNGCTPLDIFFDSEKFTDKICFSQMLKDKILLLITALGGTKTKAMSNEMDSDHIMYIDDCSISYDGFEIDQEVTKIEMVKDGTTPTNIHGGTIYSDGCVVIQFAGKRQKATKELKVTITPNTATLYWTRNIGNLILVYDFQQ